jgi:putative acetyltransferase
MMVRVVIAAGEADIADARTLMDEYQSLLGVDLCFQGFAQELRELPGAYAPPRGRLLLAHHGDALAGCVALRDAGERRCEMKRLFVRPGARALGIGRALVERVVHEARELGYAEMVLDTLPAMSAAQRLYEELGFRSIAPYCVNPIPGTRYLGRRL